MRILYWLGVIYIALSTLLFLPACSTTPVYNTHTPPTQAHTSKNPLAITLYSHKQTLVKPYTVIGRTSIPEYNTGGIKRQEACLHDTLRSLAASMGGDAIINILHNNKKVVGTVIAYQSTKNEKTAV